jgi:hypothetical protein
MWFAMRQGKRSSRLRPSRALTSGIVATAAVVSMWVAVASGRQTAPKTPAQPIVEFSADDFWLNLHHFLYVLGRVEAKMPDAPRLADVPPDQQRGLATLGTDEQTQWRAAVSAYASSLSRRDAVSDRQLVAVTQALAAIGDAASLPAASPALAPTIVKTLETAAPIYRKAWWPAHHRANQKWIAETGALVDRHGAQILAFLTRAYELPWLAGGYPVHASAHANWAGAYSTDGPLLVIASLAESNYGLPGLELVFHESMHQWDDPILARLEEIGRSIDKSVPDGLTHAMIWLAAGEAVRRTVPGHVPIAEAGGIWLRGSNPALRPAIDAAWLPYLNGAGTRDEALAALMKLAGKPR